MKASWRLWYPISSGVRCSACSLIKTPKLHFLDSGLLGALRNLTPERMADDRTPFGAALESFVFGEV